MHLWGGTMTLSRGGGGVTLQRPQQLHYNRARAQSMDKSNKPY